MSLLFFFMLTEKKKKLGNQESKSNYEKTKIKTHHKSLFSFIYIYIFLE